VAAEASVDLAGSDRQEGVAVPVRGYGWWHQRTAPVVWGSGTGGGGRGTAWVDGAVGCGTALA
jgi:hypothetical protein